MSADVFFDGWEGPARVVVAGVLAYVALIVLFRVTGNRTLSKMNAFDFVITVAFGSALASVMLSDGVVLAEGVTALALLVVLQFVVTFASVRAGWVKRVATGEPRLLFAGGEMLRGAMRRARVTEDEVRAAARAQGVSSMASVAAVVMETDGSFSVIPASGGEPTSLRGVRGWRGSRTEAA